ncbi:MAG: hypothetical protein ABSF62_05165 [Bryobacteraceae bacterium]
MAMRKLVVVAAVLIGMTQIDFAQKETPITLPLDDGQIRITAQFIRVNGYGSYVPELTLALENQTSSAWTTLKFLVDIGGLCNGEPRHWSLPVITSLGPSCLARFPRAWCQAEGHSFVKEYKDTSIPLIGKVDGCKAEIFKASLVLAENSKTRIDGVTGERVDLEKQLQELKAKHEAEVTAQAEEKRRAAEVKAEETRKAVEAQAKKDAADLKLFTDSIKLSAPRLPPHFMGNDIVQLFKAHEMIRTAQKSEYETSAQFKTRIGISETNFFNKTTLSLVVAVVSEYDADERVLKVGVECSDPHGISRRVSNSISVKSSRAGRVYEASNAFGAKANIQETDVESFHVGVNNASDFPITTAKYLMSSIKSGPDEARQIKIGLSGLVICAIARGDDITTDDSILSKATFDNPHEYFEQMHFLNARVLAIWFFDSSTGKVYAKVEPEK